MKIAPEMTVLIVEDSPTLISIYKNYLRNESSLITYVETGEKALAHIKKKVPDAILLDLILPDINGMEILKYIHEQQLHSAVVIITAQNSVDLAVKAMRYKAFDFIVKPFDNQRLIITLHNALRHQQLSRTVVLYKEKFDRTQYYDFIGACPPMQAVYQIIENAASSKATVFITGESGTGKEICAEAIHKQSSRRNKPFIVLNCAAIPKDLMESEIFGHVKGAFTGALNERVGAASLAHNGTLFLDEICEMNLSLQTKLLRFIQTGIVQKVGAERSENVNVRFICATNREPLAEVQNGRFREDLYYRLHVIPICLPPLRERKDDILLLAQHFLLKYTKEENKSLNSCAPEIQAILLHYDWPGNVRELQNVINNIVVLNNGKEVTHAMLPAPLNTIKPYYSENQIKNIHPISKKRLPPTNIIPLLEREKEIIEEAIVSCGSIYKAAQMLEISPSTIYRKRQNWLK